MSLEFLADELEAIRAANRWRTQKPMQSMQGPRVTREGRRVVNFASNAYLGLQAHPDIQVAAQAAVRSWGTGAGASRLLAGTNELHQELERAIAHLKRTEDAVLFSSGYLANLGVLPALAGKGDLIVSDELNHASLIDGCRLSRASVRIFPHADTAAAARILEAERPRNRRAIILTDGLFGMDGDLAPLGELARLAKRHDAILYVDDAHGTGVLGETGAGTAEHLGVGDVDVHMGTLSKAFASEGGFIAGSQELCDFLRHRARSFVFSTAPAPAPVAAALAAINLAANRPELRARLQENQSRFRSGLRGLGWPVAEGVTPVIPIPIGPSDAAMRAMTKLEEQGVWVPAIRPPTVPEGTSRLRASVMATHEPRDLEAALSAFQTLTPPKEGLPSAPLSS